MNKKINLLDIEKRDSELYARVPKKLKEEIEKIAKASGRSKSAEVTIRLLKILF